MKELKIENLCCNRGETRVLNQINLSIRSGETLVVKGPNGSGKTTLLRILSNYFKSYQGKVLFDGLNILEDPLYNTKFNFVGQKNSLKSNLSVKKNFILWDILFNTSINHIKLLKENNFDNLINRDVDTLSDGQKKYISLHRLNYKNYDLWFLDEPFVFLDEDNSKLLINRINKFNDNKGIVILTSNIELTNKFHKEIRI